MVDRLWRVLFSNFLKRSPLVIKGNNEFLIERVIGFLTFVSWCNGYKLKRNCNPSFNAGDIVFIHQLRERETLESVMDYYRGRPLIVLLPLDFKVDFNSYRDTISLWRRWYENGFNRFKALLGISIPLEANSALNIQESILKDVLGHGTGYFYDVRIDGDGNRDNYWLKWNIIFKNLLISNKVVDSLSAIVDRNLNILGKDGWVV